MECESNLAIEQKVKAGDEKVGAEETRKAGISFGGKHGWETTTTIKGASCVHGRFRHVHG